MDSLLDANDLAALLKISVIQVRELSRTRTQRNSLHPLPTVKFSRKVTRYERGAIEVWIAQVAAQSQAKAGAQ
jgi:hypothetical protein